MKKALAALLVLLLPVVIVVATEPIRIVQVGPAALTNAVHSRPWQLVKVEAFTANSVTGTVAVAQIAALCTNTVGSITLASSAGSITNLSLCVFPGDIFTFTHSGGGASATTATYRLTGQMD